MAYNEYIFASFICLKINIVPVLISDKMNSIPNRTGCLDMGLISTCQALCSRAQGVEIKPLERACQAFICHPLQALDYPFLGKPLIKGFPWAYQGLSMGLSRAFQGVKRGELTMGLLFIQGR